MRKYSFVEAITIIITEGRICSKPAIKCEQINLLLYLPKRETNDSGNA